MNKQQYIDRLLSAGFEPWVGDHNTVGIKYKDYAIQFVGMDECVLLYKNNTVVKYTGIKSAVKKICDEYGLIIYPFQVNK